MISLLEYDSYDRYFQDNRALPTLAVEDLLQTAKHGLGLRLATMEFLHEAKIWQAELRGTPVPTKEQRNYLATLLDKLEATLANADNYVNNMRRTQHEPTAGPGEGHGR